MVSIVEEECACPVSCSLKLGQQWYFLAKINCNWIPFEDVPFQSWRVPLKWSNKLIYIPMYFLLIINKREESQTCALYSSKFPYYNSNLFLLMILNYIPRDLWAQSRLLAIISCSGAHIYWRHMWLSFRFKYQIFKVALNRSTQRHALFFSMGPVRE